MAMSLDTRRIAALLLLPLIVGCRSSRNNDLFNVLPAKTQAEAGSVHVAVLSVAPWEEYATALQPTFTMSAEDALAQSVASTLSLQESVIDALRVGLALRLPTSTDATTRTTTDTDGERTRTETRTETEGPPDVTGLAAPGDLPADLSAAAPALPTNLGVDPLLHRQAATALYQEVQLLNRYIRDAVARDGYKPYVVRLQISLLPTARNRPYDAYSTISFFGDPIGPGPAMALPGSANPGAVGGLPDLLNGGARIASLGSVDSTGISAGHQDPAPPPVAPLGNAARGRFLGRVFLGSSKENPIVVPLLVTDDLESTVHSRTLDQIRQFAMSLMFMIQNVGGAAEFERFREDLQTVMGRDFNSLLTVGRVSDNSYRVRLGAMQQVASHHAMVPRTHNITMLLLVPCEIMSTDRLVHLASKTEMQDSRTGELLPGRPEESLNSQLLAISKRYEHYGLRQQVSLVELRNLWVHAQMNRGADFSIAVNKLLKSGTAPELFPRGGLWVDMVSLLSGGQFAVSSFEVPVRLLPTLFVKPQTALLFDDTKRAALATLHSGNRLRSDLVSAHLEVKEKGTTTADDKIFTFVAEKVEILPNGREGRFTFPSPVAWGHGGGTMTLHVDCPECSPRIEDDLCDGAPGDAASFSVLPVAKVEEPKTPDPEFTATVRPSFIWADRERRGSVTIDFRKSAPDKPAKIFFDVSGADVENVTCSTGCLESSGTLVVVKDGTVKLELRNLTSQVTVSAGVKPDKLAKVKDLAVLRP